MFDKKTSLAEYKKGTIHILLCMNTTRRDIINKKF